MPTYDDKEEIIPVKGKSKGKKKEPVPLKKSVSKLKYKSKVKTPKIDEVSDHDFYQKKDN